LAATPPNARPASATNQLPLPSCGGRAGVRACTTRWACRRTPCGGRAGMHHAVGVQACTTRSVCGRVYSPMSQRRTHAHMHAHAHTHTHTNMQYNEYAHTHIRIRTSTLHPTHLLHAYTHAGIDDGDVVLAPRRLLELLHVLMLARVGQRDLRGKGRRCVCVRVCVLVCVCASVCVCVCLCMSGSVTCSKGGCEEWGAYVYSSICVFV